MRLSPLGHVEGLEREHLRRQEELQKRQNSA